MKLLLFMGLALVSMSAVAVEAVVSDPPIDLEPIITALLGDKAGLVIVVVSVLGYTWAQVRQLIPADYMARLPKWLIWFLELMAANKGNSQNAQYNRPESVKKWGG